MTNFGEHLTIDAYGCKSFLGDKATIESVIRKIAKHEGMHLLFGPKTVRANPNTLKDGGGWSAFAIIQESHISIHTFEKQGFLSADIYTCRDGMDVVEILDLFKDYFQPEKMENNFIVRGKEFSKYENLQR